MLRRKPPGKLLKSAHMVEREFRVLQALEGVGFPAPRALALCEDESVVGSVFYLMSHRRRAHLLGSGAAGARREERAAIYDAMNAALARLHAIDVAAAGLADYGKPGSYFARQLQRWSEQYRASETENIADMDRLIVWLGHNVPPDDGRVALVHGDWRIDNMIFDPDAPRLLAILDWELSTLGHPFADLAYQCMQWRLPNAAASRGLAGLDRAALGHSERSRICRGLLPAGRNRRRARLDVPHRLQLFRIAAIVQGVYKRSLDGNASNPQRGGSMGDRRAADGAPRDGGDRSRRFDRSPLRPRPLSAARAPCGEKPAMLSGAPTLRRDLHFPPAAPERWQSGRSRRTRNAEYAQAYRGFESPPSPPTS